MPVITALAPTYGLDVLPRSIITWLVIAVILLFVAGVRLERQLARQREDAPNLAATGWRSPARFYGRDLGWIAYAEFSNQPVNPGEGSIAKAVVPWIAYFYEDGRLRSGPYPVDWSVVDSSGIDGGAFRDDRPETIKEVDFLPNGIPYWVELTSVHFGTREFSMTANRNGSGGGSMLWSDDEPRVLLVEVRVRGVGIDLTKWFRVESEEGHPDIPMLKRPTVITAPGWSKSRK